jgi:CHAT domain-containing protein
LAKPEPTSVQTVQQLLRKNEVLIQFSLTDANCFVWLVTPNEVRWYRLSIEYRQLIEMVTALRQQLDVGRFNLNLAFSIFHEIFGAMLKKLDGKELLIVSPGVLGSLPFHLLVTEKPEATDDELTERYRHAAWLIESHSISTLPSVSALKLLRQRVVPSMATRPYLGIGNPLLIGPSGNDRRAWGKVGCRSGPPDSFVDVGASVVRGLSSYFRGVSADNEQIRHLVPLPETVNELCAVGASFGQTEDALLMGADASEESIQRFNANGLLSDVRILHFATHGLVSGEIQGLAEPALVLTPPMVSEADQVTSENDGLLTASEVAQLRLDADWVVLSACNTAAGNGRGGEALSGLARAFFYAGARALLVSHWAVNTEAAVKIMVGTFTAMAQDPSLGRAEALRKAMLDIIKKGKAEEVHPRYWAPFVIIGAELPESR